MTAWACSRIFLVWSKHHGLAIKRSSSSQWATITNILLMRSWVITLSVGEVDQFEFGHYSRKSRVSNGGSDASGIFSDTNLRWSGSPLVFGKAPQL